MLKDGNQSLRFGLGWPFRSTDDEGFLVSGMRQEFPELKVFCDLWRSQQGGDAVIRSMVGLPGSEQIPSA